MSRPGDERVEARVPLSRLLLRGLARRCPRCGHGRLFRRWVRLAVRCPGCGYRFEREEGFLLGVMAINIGLSSVVLMAYLVGAFVLTVPDPPVFALTVAGMAIGALTPVVLYPVAKTLWAAIDLAMRPLDVVEAAEAMSYLAAARGERAGEGDAGGR